MNNYEQHFNWPGAHLEHFYVFFALAAITAGYLVFKSDSKYKLELFFISFYLLTGNINDILTIKIPGFSFFEIQPIRLIYLLLFSFILRKKLLSREKLHFTINKKIPWFEVVLYCYVLLITLSVLVNMSQKHMDVGEGLKTILDSGAFLIILVGLKLMADKPTSELIGKSIIIGAVASAIVSLVQISIDPYFLRIGDARLAFGQILRSNGIFSAEYTNSYYLIIAIAWTVTTIKKVWLKTSLIFLFFLGVLTTFHRMSWIILALLSVIYLVFIYKLAFEKLFLIVLSCLALVLSLSIFYYQDFMNSTIVKERLTETVEGREGYYALVLDNIGEKPLFGYGNFNHEAYYSEMLQITSSRQRATGETGGLHSGYFSTLFLYGIPAFLFFILFVLLSVFYYARLCKENLYFVIPLFVSIIFLIGNLTNTFLFLSDLSVLFAIHIGLRINKFTELDSKAY